MGKIKPKAYKLKTGEKAVIRTAEAGDAKAILEHARSILAEDVYNVRTLEEFEMEMTVEKERERIKSHHDKPAHIALVAEVDGSIVGSLGFENGSRKRLAHRGTLYMSVRAGFRNKGIGKALLESLVGWAEENPVIEKLSLMVFATNQLAIGLYKKMGFAEEGRQVREIKMADGKYIDGILMYKFVKG